jgi:YD repeat-containing protein
MKDLTRNRMRLLFLCALIPIMAFVSFPAVCHAEEYTYNDDGQVTQVTHDDGSVTVYEYDKNGNLIQTRTISPAQKAPSGSDGKNTEDDGEKQGEAEKKTEDTGKTPEDDEKRTDDQKKDESGNEENGTEEAGTESETEQGTTEDSSETVKDPSDDGDSSGKGKDSSDKVENPSDGSDKTGANMQTGDEFPLGLVVTILALALLGVGAVIFMKVRNREK